MLYLFTQDSSRTLKLTIVFNEQHESRRVGITIRNGMKKHPLGMNESYTPSQPSQPNQAKQSYKTEKETNHNTIQKCRRIEEQEKKKQAPSFTHKLFPMLQQVYFHSLLHHHHHRYRYHPSQASLPPVPYVVDSEGGPRNCPRSYPGRAYIVCRDNRGSGYGVDIGISIYGPVGCWR